MSYVNKKARLEPFTFHGGETFTINGIAQNWTLIFDQITGDVSLWGERLGERFFEHKYIYKKNIYKPFSIHLHNTRVFVRAYAREENTFFVERKSKNDTQNLMLRLPVLHGRSQRSGWMQAYSTDGHLPRRRQRFLSSRCAAARTSAATTQWRHGCRPWRMVKGVHTRLVR